MIHKAQGSTYYHMKGNLGHSVNSNKQISSNILNTLLSPVKSRGKGKRLNFKPSYIKVIGNALKELNWMRNKARFSWKDLAEMLLSLKTCLLNIKSWNCHIAHFLVETSYPTTSSLMCFTETTKNGANFRDIGSYENNWKSFHKFFGHVLVIIFRKIQLTVI